MKHLLTAILLLAFAHTAAGERNVSLERDFGTLYGTLLTPDAGTETVAVIIAGSGPTPRNGNVNSYLYLAQALEKAGIASLRYDKRGIGASRFTEPEKMAEWLTAMAPAGRLDAVPESLIDAASAVSGCGPAWAYQFIEALADGGVAAGLPRAKAQEYAAQMLLGSARMVLETGKHPGELKDAVCSPGGSTIQGVRLLEERAFRGAVTDAVLAAFEKTKDLGKK